MKKRFTEEQIIGSLREAEAGSLQRSGLVLQALQLLLAELDTD